MNSKRSIGVILTVLILIFLFCPLISAKEQRKHAVVTVESRLPWEDVDNDGKVTGGIAVELISEMLNRMNVDIVFRNVPFARAIHEVSAGESDFVLMVSRTDERKKFMLFTVPVWTKEERLCYSTEKFSSFEWNDWEDLSKYTIGIVRSYDYGQEWEQAVRTWSYRAVKASDDMSNIKRLLFGKYIDFIIISESVQNSFAKELQEVDKKLRCAAKSIHEDDLHFGLSKKSHLAGRISEMNDTLIKMKLDGTFKRCLKSYYKEMP